MPAPKEHLIECLKILCAREGGCQAVAEQSGVNADYLWQIVAGIKLPSGEPRGVGPRVGKRLTKAFPGWAYLIDPSAYPCKDAKGLSGAIKPAPGKSITVDIGEGVADITVIVKRASSHVKVLIEAHQDGSLVFKVGDSRR